MRPAITCMATCLYLLGPSLSKLELGGAMSACTSICRYSVEPAMQARERTETACVTDTCSCGTCMVS